jgi:Uma2 family endonuclease
MTSTAIRTRRPAKRWTYADYCRIPADGKRHEILGGRHFVNPAPDLYHQTVAARLLYELMRRIEKRGRGRVLTAPIDVHIEPGSIVQPDLVVVATRHASILGPEKLRGAPDLLVEILSPSTQQHDRERKRALYERAGVREFWLVDPKARTIAQLVLRSGRYGPAMLATEKITLRTFRGISIDLAQVW